MSSSDDENNHQEDDSLCKYGTQLPQYEAGKFFYYYTSNFQRFIFKILLNVNR